MVIFSKLLVCKEKLFNIQSVKANANNYLSENEKNNNLHAWVLSEIVSAELPQEPQSIDIFPNRPVTLRVRPVGDNL